MVYDKILLIKKIMMNRVFWIFIICFNFFACDILSGKKENNTEPPYNTKIIWTSDLISNDSGSHIIADDSVFFFERPHGYTKVNIYSLTRLNAQTGTIIWQSSVIFSNIIFCQPQVMNDYIYVFLQPNVILCFNKNNGDHTATININIENKRSELYLYFPIVHNEYIYMSLCNDNDNYFIRLNAKLINQNYNCTIIQNPTPEIIWKPESGLSVTAKPVIWNNTVFTATRGTGDKPVELAGFDIDNLNMIFHCTFGGHEDISATNPHYERGDTENPILIHEGTLYYLGGSIGAWDIISGKKLYRHIYSYAIPESERYWSDCYQSVYYRDNIYFNNITAYEPNRFNNIHCIKAATGKLVWNTIAKDSYSIRSNPVIANNKLYVPQHHGLWVYDPETGKLLGVDRSYNGADMGRNILYNNFMICIQKDQYGDGRLVAIDVSK